ncbi:pyridoxal phosphate-dependent aminotransferase [Paraburkholderia sp. D15]|uniref:pyridoxal phosphate-dependent aminotransferase n=1 Tax=Paraburkholderia sp. D15 TaxID=2880218 RepID=UPI002479342F|nr:pyridoxal phosphate-dependent aminotransferase [Paraburkholderia sp. D15]WGS51763.1 pyridoxal phosphate-dependent aminotransferase [Paraburkholderia sp. D15]
MATAHKRAGRVSDIADFHVLQISNAARALAQQGHDVIRMEIGEPDFSTPKPVIAAAEAALRDTPLGYTCALGIPELREAISRFYATRFGVDVPASRVVVTSGSSAALLLVCAMLFCRDDEVLVSDPSYPCNRQFIRTMEARAVGVPVGPESHYQLTAELIEQHWNERTRAALLTTPSNPTGALIPQDALERMAAVVRARKGALIVDEIYQGLVYDGAASTALSVTDDAFVINSFSKYFNMTGWRLGWMVVPDGAQKDIEKLAQNLFICPPTLAQKAALACFETETLEILEYRKSQFRARRDLLVPALRELGFRIPVVPGGGFYIYADSSELATDSQAFCADMLARTHVAFTPGIDFGTYRAREHVRFAYAAPFHKLEEAVERIELALRTAVPC